MIYIVWLDDHYGQILAKYSEKYSKNIKLKLYYVNNLKYDDDRKYNFFFKNIVFQRHQINKKKIIKTFRNNDCKKQLNGSSCITL